MGCIYWQDGRVEWEGGLEGHREFKKAELRNNATTAILKVYPVWKQINISMEIGTSDLEKSEYTSFVNNIRDKVSIIDASIDAAQSHEEIDAVDTEIKE